MNPDPSLACLRAQLHAAFDAEALEDGMDHPAEAIIEATLHGAQGADVADGFREMSLDSAKPVFAASVLRCLGRLPSPETASWRVALVREALTSPDVRIRDAAAQAAESWGDSAMRDVLTSHAEPVRWLRDYIGEVAGGS